MKSCLKTKYQARFVSFLFPFFLFLDQAAEKGVVGKPEVKEQGDMETGELFIFPLSIFYRGILIYKYIKVVYVVLKYTTVVYILSK